MSESTIPTKKGYQNPFKPSNSNVLMLVLKILINPFQHSLRFIKQKENPVAF